MNLPVSSLLHVVPLKTSYNNLFLWGQERLLQIAVLYFPKSLMEVIYRCDSETTIVLLTLNSHGLDRASYYPNKCRLNTWWRSKRVKLPAMKHCVWNHISSKKDVHTALYIVHVYTQNSRLANVRLDRRFQSTLKATVHEGKFYAVPMPQSYASFLQNEQASQWSSDKPVRIKAWCLLRYCLA